MAATRPRTRRSPDTLPTLGWLRCALALALLGLAGTAAPGRSATLPPGLFDRDPALPWTIRAATIAYDDKTDVYTAQGAVVIRKGDRRLSADAVRFDQRRRRVSAWGRVTVSVGPDLLWAERIELDLADETGALTEGSLFLAARNMTLRSAAIAKVGPHTYTADRVVVTTCDADPPAWALTGRRLKVDLNGRSTVRHATFRIRGVPVLYSPYLFFPARKERQSGLLLPYAATSDRLGLELQQPFYWAGGDRWDATAYAHYLEKRGLKWGLETRWVTDADSRGTLMADGLQDRRVDDGRGASETLWGYSDDGAAVRRPNTDRYWLRLKADQRLDAGWSAALDVDWVSDQDVLTEFREGYTGYGDTERTFLTDFGRQIEDYADPVRTSRLNLQRLWPSMGLNVEMRWLDDVVARRQGTRDTTAQRLPRVAFTALRQPLGGRSWLGSDLLGALDASYAHFYSPDGDRGHRLDVHPAVSLPLHPVPGVTLDTRVGVRETVWQVQPRGAGQADEILTRELFDLNLDLSAEFRRIGSRGTLMHGVRPQVTYAYLPDKTSTDWPDFDGRDRIAGRNTLTYGVTNRLVGQRTIARDADRASDRSPDVRYDQLLRLKLYQSYDFEPDGDRSFSPVTAELDLRPNDHAALSSQAAWCPYDNRFVTLNTTARLEDTRGDRFFVEHSRDADDNEEIYLDAVLRLSSRMAAYGEYERDLRTGSDISLGVGLMVEAQCWAVRAGFISEEDDRKVEFLIDLYGLVGGSGSDIGRRPPRPFETD